MSICGIPLQRVYPAPIRVQGHAQATSLELNVGGDAPLIDPLMRIVNEAILRISEGHVRDAGFPIRYAHGRVPTAGLAPLRDVVHLTFLRGVQSRLGGVLVAHTLDDVDLAVDGPIGLVG